MTDEPKKKINVGKILKALVIGVVIASKLDILRGWIGSKAKNMEVKDVKEL